MPIFQILITNTITNVYQCEIWIVVVSYQPVTWYLQAVPALETIYFHPVSPYSQ